MEIFLIVGLTTIAAGVGTLTGFGTSTVMVPVLSLFYPLPETLLFVGIIHWCGDVWKMTFFRKGKKPWVVIASFGIAGILASYIGASLSLSLSEDILLKALGVFLLVYVGYIVAKPEFKIATSTPFAITGGLLSGITAGLFGVGGAVRSAFLTMYNQPKEVYIFVSGAIAFAIDATRIGTYFFGGTVFDQFSWLTIVLSIPASFLGAYLAKRIVDKIEQKYFRVVIGIFLAAVALRFIIFS